MTQAKCKICLGIASGETFEIAKSKIDHAIGLRMGRPCPNNSADYIIEIVDDSAPKIVYPPKVIKEPKKVEPSPEQRPKHFKPRSVKQTKPSKKQSI